MPTLYDYLDGQVADLADDDVFTLSAAARANDPRLIRTAIALVSDDMAVQLAGAVSRVGAAMLPAK